MVGNQPNKISVVSEELRVKRCHAHTTLGFMYRKTLGNYVALFHSTLRGQIIGKLQIFLLRGL